VTGASSDVLELLRRADDVWKASATRDRGPARERVAGLLADARDRLPAVADETVRLDLAARIARRAADLDRDALDDVLGPSPEVARAPTRGVDPDRVPPGQHLTAGWPVLHVGSPPRDGDQGTWRVTVTGRVRQRTVLTVTELRERLPNVRIESDFHCVTGWSRLDNTWDGVRLRDLLALAAPRPEATHLVAAGHPAYSADLDLAAATGDGVLVAWAHDRRPLAVAHGGPVRLVVPARYGWKSVKWLTELRLTERPVRGYWEERGYHDVADPWREQRFRDLLGRAW
jgi:DMSO/TMAO reductase YedYZ molybdopterin-dependent catalytic subunit